MRILVESRDLRREFQPEISNDYLESNCIFELKIPTECPTENVSIWIFERNPESNVSIGNFQLDISSRKFHLKNIHWKFGVQEIIRFGQANRWGVDMPACHDKANTQWLAISGSQRH